MSTPETQHSHEERNEHLDLYVMFKSEEEREHAKRAFEEIIKEDKEKGIYILPAGPDYPMALSELPKNVLNGDFEEISNDPLRPGVGLKFSFKHTPSLFSKPEDLSAFIIMALEDKGLNIQKRAGHTETYEVVGLRQKGNVF